VAPDRELERVLTLLGCPNARDVDSDYVVATGSVI
jgi:hypothetical protein